MFRFSRFSALQFFVILTQSLLAVGPMDRVDIPELFWDILGNLRKSPAGSIMNDSAMHQIRQIQGPKLHVKWYFDLLV